MRGTVAALVCVGLALPIPAAAQTNNDDFTPLNSRIKRARQFPDQLPPRFVPADKLTSAQRERSRTMLDQLGRCLYKRSNSVALDFLDKTDLGFVNFEQIELAQDRALKIFGFSDCLGRVANANNSGVSVRFAPGSLRLWLIQAAYFSKFPDGPTWVRAGNVIGNREYPLSGDDPGIRMVLDFADCIVATDPNNADYFYRTVGGSPDESEAVKALTPSLGPCLPQGIQLQIAPYSLRVWIGEALWQAANHSAPPSAEIVGGAQ